MVSADSRACHEQPHSLAAVGERRSFRASVVMGEVPRGRRRMCFSQPTNKAMKTPTGTAKPQVSKDIGINLVRD